MSFVQCNRNLGACNVVQETKGKIFRWLQKLKIKCNAILKKRKATAYDFFCEINRKWPWKYFNNVDNFWINQQVIRMRVVFRGIMVKDLVAIPLEIIDYAQHNKVITQKAVIFFMNVELISMLCCIFLRFKISV